MELPTRLAPLCDTRAGFRISPGVAVCSRVFATALVGFFAWGCSETPSDLGRQVVTEPVLAVQSIVPSVRTAALLTRGRMPPEVADAIARRWNLTILHRFHFQDAVLVAYGSDADLAGVSAEPTVVGVSLGAPVYPLDDVRSWGFNDSPRGHRFGLVQNTGAPPAKLAIVDSGIDCNNPDFFDDFYGGNICLLSQSFVPGSSPYVDQCGHGTRVASVAVARANGVGVQGAARGAFVASYKVFDDMCAGATCITVAAAIDAATYALRDVINLSLGLLDTPATRQDCVMMEDAINFAFGAGLFVVVSAGNAGGGPVTLPAAYDNAFAVSGLTCGAIGTSSGTQPCGRNAEWWFGSSQGPQVDVAAAAENVALAAPGGGVIYRSGTSFAAPHVSAAAMLLIDAYPESQRQAQALAAHLKAKAYLPVGSPYDPNRYGAGILDARRALDSSPCATASCYLHPDP